MTTDHQILTLAQWLSPAYPVGAFAYSHGLEAAISQGLIDNATALEGWLCDILRHGGGRSDCILLHLPHGAADTAALAGVNATALAFAASAERRQETTLQGRAFAQTTAAIWDDMPTDLAYPVAVGHACARLWIDPGLAAALFAQAMMSNLIACAQRLMALGQTEGQAILSRLSPICHDMGRDTAGAAPDDLASTAFLSDIAAMRHETLQPRIFRT